VIFKQEEEKMADLKKRWPFIAAPKAAVLIHSGLARTQRMYVAKQCFGLLNEGVGDGIVSLVDNGRTSGRGNSRLFSPLTVGKEHLQ